MSETETKPRRRGRRDREAAPERKVDYHDLISPLPLMNGYSDDQILAIHEAALQILGNPGVRVLHPGALKRLEAAGAEVRDGQVLFPRALVEWAVKVSPELFTITSPGGVRTLGGRHTNFLPVGGPPHATDIERGKRSGTFQDFQAFIRLAQHYDVIHMTGPSVEPQDVPTNIRHLRMMRVQMLDSDKATFIYSRGAAQVADGFELVRLRMGLDPEAFRKKPYCFTVINTNSPLTLDLPMCQGLIDFAEAGQISIITPFTLSGAMAPATIPGALVQQHAEFLSGLVLAQIVRPGAPIVYGGFTSNVDMKSGAPAFGTPEYVRACWGTGQLARLVKLPWRSSASCASNTADTQAIWETQMALWGALLGGANMVLHAAGWLEGGLSASYEKFILDVEQLQHMAELMQPVSFEPEDLAMDAIREVGSGGHHFGTAHTMARYQTAFYRPMVSDWSNYGQWMDAGALTATERAQTIWHDVLDSFVPPPVAAETAEAIDAFIAKRVGEGGAEPVS